MAHKSNDKQGDISSSLRTRALRALPIGRAPGKARLTWLDVCSFGMVMTKAHGSSPELILQISGWCGPRYSSDSDIGAYCLYTHIPHTSIYRVLPSPFKLVLLCRQCGLVDKSRRTRTRCRHVDRRHMRAGLGKREAAPL